MNTTEMMQTESTNEFVPAQMEAEGLEQTDKELQSVEVELSSLSDELGNQYPEGYRKTVSDDTVGAFFKEMSRYPLLNAEEEVELAQQVQFLLEVEETKQRLKEELQRTPSKAECAEALGFETAKQFEHRLHKGRIAKRKMIRSNLRLVVSIAKRYLNRGVPFLDLIQEGAIGLNRAAEKFDPNKGYKFSTYAYWWIRQAITRAIAEKGRTIRLPIHITEKLNKIKKVQRQLTQQLGRSATTGEIAEELGLTPKQIRECLERARLPLSLDLRVGDNQDTELGDLLEDTGASPEDYALQSSMRTDLESIMVDLTPQQKQVLALRFGLEDGQTMTLSKIGAHLNISRERVRQIEREALSKLRKRKQDMNDYLAS